MAKNTAGKPIKRIADVTVDQAVVEAGGSLGDGDDEGQVEEELERSRHPVRLGRVAWRHADVELHADIFVRTEGSPSDRPHDRARAGVSKPCLRGTSGAMTTWTAAPFVPASGGLRGLARASQGCQGCPLYQDATQTVFGEGPGSARIDPGR